jgi:hypothetical protein
VFTLSLTNFNPFVKRILKFGDGLDFAMMGICTVSAVGAGIAMPLMFLVFGKMVGDFTGFFTPSPTPISSFTPTNSTLMHLMARDSKAPMTKERFMREIDKNTLVNLMLDI